MSKVFIWKPHWRHEKVSEERCRAAVADGGRSVGFHQCVRKPVVFVDGIGFCRQHSPEEQERRDRESRERHQSQMEEIASRSRRSGSKCRVVELAKRLRDSGWTLTDELIAQLDEAIREATE